MCLSDPKQIVRASYDKLADAYYQSYVANDTLRNEWINGLIPLLLRGNRVLDLGCGCGLPATRLLSEHFNVVGVDISPEQIARAAKAVPAASFECADICDVSFENESFDAVVSLYAVIHIPLEEQPALFNRIQRLLKSGGYALMTLGNTASTDIVEDWLGVEGAAMYWSHGDREFYRKLLVSLDFDIISQEFIPEGPGGHTLFLARKN